MTTTTTERDELDDAADAELAEEAAAAAAGAGLEEKLGLGPDADPAEVEARANALVSDLDGSDWEELLRDLLTAAGQTAEVYGAEPLRAYELSILPRIWAPVADKWLGSAFATPEARAALVTAIILSPRWAPWAVKRIFRLARRRRGGSPTAAASSSPAQAAPENPAGSEPELH